MPDARERKIYSVTIAGSIINLVLLAFKFTAGILGRSSAMIADAIHSLSDFITDIIVLVMVRISNKPKDKYYDYGRYKYETLATLFIGLALAAVGVKVGVDGIRKVVFCIGGGVLPHPGSIALYAALASVLLKEIIYKVTIKVSREVDSPALKANAWHHRSDALSSIGTSLGIGGAIFLGDKWAVLDPAAAVVVSVFIIMTAWDLIHESSVELLEKSLPQDVEDRIKEVAYMDTDAFDVHNMHTRRIGRRIAVEMHVRFDGNMTLYEAHEHASRIEQRIKDEFGANTHVILHLEPKKPTTNKQQ